VLIAAARERLGELGRRLRAALAPVDVLVLPTTPGAAPLRDPAGGDSPERRERRHAAELTRLCGPVNAAGLAAVSVFGGLDAAGLPLGVQIVARDEATALGAVVACEGLAGPPPRPLLHTVAGAAALAGHHPSAEEM
jgi:aspartyl-tRNA(Asn)/glutamyl-tRNA(Gln) amidotransferase subunit A